MTKNAKPIKFGIALIPVGFLISALAVTIVGFKQSPHIPLILSAAVAALIAVIHHHPWREIQDGMVRGITLAMGAILILMVVGTMMGTWILGGVVPSMIFYGLKVLSPGIFLVATLIICSIVSLGTGSSWSTAGTVGVALVGVGRGLGIPVSMVAGAIISGAYFGDKMSPLSDTTNLAPAVAGTDLFSHIRHMIYTVTPSYILAAIIYGFIGTKFSKGTLDTANIDLILATLKNNFRIHWLMLIPPLLVIIMVVKKIPPLPALLGGTIIGALYACFGQGSSIAETFQAAYAGYASNSGVPMVDELLSRGGLLSMMETVALILCALSFGGIMEKNRHAGDFGSCLAQAGKENRFFSCSHHFQLHWYECRSR